jgi:ankyrin repeat protein
LIDLHFDRPGTVTNPETVDAFLERMRQAIDAGADIEAEDEYGNTPLLNVVSWAGWSGSDWGANRIVALLLERGADPRRAHRLLYGMTPLHITAFSLWPNIELIEMLCAAGADSKTPVASDGFGTPYEMSFRMDHPLPPGPRALVQSALERCGKR